MIYEQFLKRAGNYSATMPNPRQYSYDYRRKTKDEPIPTEIEIRWETGGARGGDCWGGTAESYSCSDPEPDFEELDKVLENVCPAITFLQYRKVASKVIEEDTDARREYYGNHTEYGVKRVVLRDLYDALVGFNIISGEKDESDSDSGSAG